MNAFAKKSGLTQPAISIMESTQPNPKLDSLLRMARALGLNLGEVLDQALRNVESPTTIPRAGPRKRPK
ncbi:MAG: helix-turn-helix transcriptional regulator [Verrucomicrobia bacterium]|nr:helix-turn-helix transcriptional regulator [Verrucomicrobiota bacterium]